MHFAGRTPGTKFWLVNEVDEETGKMGVIIPRNPSRYKELKERSNGQVIWTHTQVVMYGLKTELNIKVMVRSL